MATFRFFFAGLAADGGPSPSVVEGGVWGWTGWHVAAAHCVMTAMRSMRALLLKSVISWGDTWSSPVPSVVALGTITAGGGKWGEEWGTARESVSSKSRTKELIVSRTFPTSIGVVAWGIPKPGWGRNGLKNVEGNGEGVAAITRGWWWYEGKKG